MDSATILKAMFILTMLVVTDAKNFMWHLSVYGSVQCATDNATVVVPLSDLQLGIPPGTPDAVRCAFGCNRYEGCVAYNYRQQMNGVLCELYTVPSVFCGTDVSCQYYQVTESLSPCRLLVSESAWEWNTLTITCPSNTSITIVFANFGRLSQNCRAATSMSYVTSQCQGKQSCSMTPSYYLFNGDPCPGTVKNLEIKYYCA